MMIIPTIFFTEGSSIGVPDVVGCGIIMAVALVIYMMLRKM